MYWEGFLVSHKPKRERLNSRIDSPRKGYIMATSNAHKAATRRYDEKNTRQIMLKLNLKTDADILEKLDSVDNRQGYIKSLIRDDIARESEI